MGTGSGLIQLRFAATVAVLSLAGCAASGGGGGGGGGYYVTTDTSGGGSDATATSDGNAPPSGWQPAGDNAGSLPGPAPADSQVTQPVEPSELFKQAALECAQELPKFEATAAAKCAASSAYLGIFGWANGKFASVMASDDRLPGLDLVPVLHNPQTLTAGDGDIDVFECQHDPLSASGDMNAFAMQNGIWMLDPLLAAFAEGAAVWDRFHDQYASSTPPADAQSQLWNTIGQVFVAASQGQFGTVVPGDEIVSRYQNSPFMQNVLVGATSLVYFHELGHANLQHGLIKCAINLGTDKLLKRRGITLTSAQEQEIKNEIMQLARSSEAQADIYAFTVMKDLGFGAEGAMLFVAGIAGITAKSCAAQGIPADQIGDCAMTAFDPATTDHPPLAERWTLASKILLQNKDLTPMLQPSNLGTVRTKACGNGTCEATESASSCPQDCATSCTPAANSCSGVQLTYCDQASGTFKSIACGDAVCQQAGMGKSLGCGQSTAGHADCLCAVCGNGKCELGETPVACASDCKVEDCVTAGCTNESSACQQSASCLSLAQCAGNCSDSACQEQCWNNATGTAQQLYSGLIQCAIDHGCVAGG